jgi:hypothetical protein
VLPEPADNDTEPAVDVSLEEVAIETSPAPPDSSDTPPSSRVLIRIFLPVIDTSPPAPELDSPLPTRIFPLIFPAPDVRETTPLASLSPAPVDNKMSPDEPVVEAPVATSIDPDLFPRELPVVICTSPDTNADSPLEIETTPLIAEFSDPSNKDPPTSFAEAPDKMLISPPCADDKDPAAPPLMLTAPTEAASVTLPAAIVISPEEAVEPSPLVTVTSPP